VAAFHGKVFNIELASEAVDGLTIQSGRMQGIDFALVPAALTKVATHEDKVHLGIIVEGIATVMANIAGSGGRTNDRLVEDEGMKRIGVYDPDGQVIAVTERKQAARGPRACRSLRRAPARRRLMRTGRRAGALPAPHPRMRGPRRWLPAVAQSAGPRGSWASAGMRGGSRRAQPDAAWRWACAPQPATCMR
jgi:hypothetical protein